MRKGRTPSVAWSIWADRDEEYAGGTHLAARRRNQSVIACLVGPTCVGKTTVARRMAELLDWPLRSCGVAVRDRAVLLGIDIKGLPDDAHRSVDRETVAWAMEHFNCIVEGRFLDAVFFHATSRVSLIRLDASPTVRAHRGRLRGMSTFAVENVTQADAQDDVFRERLYPVPTGDEPIRVIDTSDITADECARRLLEMLEKHLPPPA